MDPEPAGPSGITVTGHVYDQAGNPLPGTTVILKGSTTGTMSMNDGAFSITVPDESAVLQFSFMGYATREITVGSQRKIRVELRELAQTIEDVVVVGYGTQSKKSVVGSIVQATSEDIERTGNVTDLRQALSGQLPGVATITSSGEPGGTGRGGSATEIYIRGRNTWNGGEPLILVDGVERSMDNVDPHEVETISVLKDASATAVFGVKGANGVILITTKRGSQGKMKVSVNYSLTTKMVSRLPEKYGSYDAIMASNESIERELFLSPASWSDFTPVEIAEKYRNHQTDEQRMIYPDVDWVDAMFKKASFTQRANVSVSGGTPFLKYFGMIGYLHEGDQIRSYDNGKSYDPNYNFDRFNFRSNFDFKITKTTNFKVNFSGYFSEKNNNWNNEGTSGPADQWMWAAAYSTPPDVYLPQYDDGRWGYSSLMSANSPNPVAAFYNLGIRTTRKIELNSDFSLEQDLGFLTEGLNFRASLAYDNNLISQGGIYDNDNHIRPTGSSNTPLKEIIVNKADGTYTISNLPVQGEQGYDWQFKPWSQNSETVGAGYWSSAVPVYRRLSYDMQLDYRRNFSDHNVGATAVFKREEYASGSEFKHYREDWVFRLTYNYAHRYLLEANGAYNGSEQFGPGYRFDFFPSIAVGWVLSEEPFYKNADWMKWLNRVKFRYSHGMVGDDRAAGSFRWRYMSQLTYDPNGAAKIVYNNTKALSPYKWYKESVIGNPDLHWEKSKKINYGVELGALDNVVTLTFDYYTEKRTDILLGGNRTAVPSFFGAVPPTVNIGQIDGKGYEIEARVDKRMKSGWRYWASFTYAHNENKVINREDPPLTEPHRKNEGFRLGQSKSKIIAGGKGNFMTGFDDIYASTPFENNDNGKLPGYYQLVDYDGDGVITAEDTVPYGYSSVPENIGTFSLGTSYKGLSFMAQLMGTSNVSRSVAFSNFSGQTHVLFEPFGNYWTPGGSGEAYLPRWRSSGGDVGNFGLYDASTLRLRIVELAYTMDKSNMRWIKKGGIEAIKISLTGNNLFLWTDLPDDREALNSGGSAAQGTYPTMKNITFGINLTF